LPEPDVTLWARRFGLESRLEDAPQTLSAGQQQLVLLASALAAAPRVLIADEALAHVDARGRAAALEAVGEAVDRGLAVLWLTQSPAEAERATRRLELAGGMLREASRGLVPHNVEAPAKTPVGGALQDPRLEITVVPGGTRVRTGGLKFRIGSRGVWVMTGANGAGKTSLLEAIAGVEELAEVRVQWHEPPDLAPILAAQYPERTIFQDQVKNEIEFAARQRGMAAPEVERRGMELLRGLDVPEDVMRRRTHLLSTGEKRLVGLVAALLAPAPLLLLDEPTCGLDPDRRRRLASVVREIGERMPVIIATQDREFVGEVGAIEVLLEDDGAANR
jgi:energy-coupling factor transporter ATP-binding protein EcfA2